MFIPHLEGWEQEVVLKNEQEPDKEVHGYPFQEKEVK